MIRILDRNIATVEDPYEINLPSVNQVNVNEKAGLTSAAAIKSFLRQDPDIIMVSHSARALALTRRLVVLVDGSLLADGPTDKLLINPRV